VYVPWLPPHCGYLSLTYGDALLDGGAIAQSSIIPCSDSEGVKLTSPLHCLVDQNVSGIGGVHLHMQDIFDELSHIMISTYYKAYGELVKYVLQCFCRPIYIYIYMYKDFHQSFLLSLLCI